jgi:hypothetical protein
MLVVFEVMPRTHDTRFKAHRESLVKAFFSVCSQCWDGYL